MFRTFKTLALSAMIGLGGLAAMPAAAQADGVYLNFGGQQDARFGVYVGDRDGRHNRWDRHDRRDRHWRACTPERALDKAERIGLRRVAVRDVTRNTIRVSGRDRGERVVVTFGRGRNCPIIRY
ncbi:hypothetical protein [Arvimicrobium flavum]|uniref:hypothetical protein n=1 Tax=Arvimicrobium flavum TaxID=3393320 RepID=UPI00237A2ED0|nr:hypothetical protein [Mesorhizobium shangrilense]